MVRHHIIWMAPCQQFFYSVPIMSTIWIRTRSSIMTVSRSLGVIPMIWFWMVIGWFWRIIWIWLFRIFPFFWIFRLMIFTFKRIKSTLRRFICTSLHHPRREICVGKFISVTYDVRQNLDRHFSSLTFLRLKSKENHSTNQIVLIRWPIRKKILNFPDSSFS